MAGETRRIWVSQFMERIISLHSAVCTRSLSQSRLLWLMIGCKNTMVVSSVVLSSLMLQYSSLCNSHLTSAVKVYVITLTHLQKASLRMVLSEIRASSFTANSKVATVPPDIVQDNHHRGCWFQQVLSPIGRDVVGGETCD